MRTSSSASQAGRAVSCRQRVAHRARRAAQREVHLVQAQEAGRLPGCAAPHRGRGGSRPRCPLPEATAAADDPCTTCSERSVRSTSLEAGGVEVRHAEVARHRAPDVGRALDQRLLLAGAGSRRTAGPGCRRALPRTPPAARSAPRAQAPARGARRAGRAARSARPSPRASGRPPRPRRPSAACGQRGGLAHHVVVVVQRADDRAAGEQHHHDAHRDQQRRRSSRSISAPPLWAGGAACRAGPRASGSSASAAGAPAGRRRWCRWTASSVKASLGLVEKRGLTAATCGSARSVWVSSVTASCQAARLLLAGALDHDEGPAGPCRARTPAPRRGCCAPRRPTARTAAARRAGPAWPRTPLPGAVGDSRSAGEAAGQLAWPPARCARWCAWSALRASDLAAQRGHVAPRPARSCCVRRAKACTEVAPARAARPRR